MKKNNIIKAIVILCFFVFTAKAIAEEYEEYKGNWHGSLMFSVTDNRKIHELLEVYRTKQEKAKNDEDKTKEDIIKDLMQSLNITTDKFLRDLPQEAPAFYLNSIAYISDNNWTIWLNGKRISFYNKEISEIFIDEVSKEKVRFLWKSKYLKYINPDWKKIKDKNIQVIPERNIIYFTLRPNQTFESLKMKIVEGKQDATPLSYHKMKNRKNQGIKVEKNNKIEEEKQVKTK